ncbi:MAG: hypothetical protein FJ293_03205 [Planctomycetes bacterium]|nr:hypothetical protein [Planctomycetota bacterium]
MARMTWRDGFGAVVLLALPCAGCGSPAMARVPVAPTDRIVVAAPAWSVPPPARQVMIGAPTTVPPDRVVVQPMDEAARTEAFRSLVGSAIRHPPPAPPAEDGATERVVRVASPHRTHVHHAGCQPGCSLGRVAVYTGLGAIIGHQFDDRSCGAAIGAGLAFLTSPWWWGRGCWFDPVDCWYD